MVDSCNTDTERLQQLLGGAGSKRFLDRLYQRLAKNPGDRGKIHLNDPTAEERALFGSLLGQHLGHVTRIVLDLKALEQMLERAQVAASLIHAVEALRGPLIDHAEQRQLKKAAWKDLFHQAASKDPRPALHQWLDMLAATGLLKRLSQNIDDAEQLMNHCMAMAALLPAKNLVTEELAARVTGDAHGLDEGRPLNTLVTSMIGYLYGQERQTTASERRSAQKTMGLMPNRLTSTVLTLGLKAAGDPFMAQILNAYAEVHEPCRLSLNQLLTHPPHFEKPGDIYICENPAIVQAAAVRIRKPKAPLICIEGQPGQAAQKLLSALQKNGAMLWYHGDFDWPGVKIANFVMRQYGAKAWRMEARDYLAANPGIHLAGEPATPIWSQALGQAMERRGLAIHEETVSDDLLRDLSA